MKLQSVRSGVEEVEEMEKEEELEEVDEEEKALRRGKVIGELDAFSVWTST